MPKNQAVKRFTIHTPTPAAGRMRRKLFPQNFPTKKNTENKKRNEKNGLAKLLMYGMLIHHKGTEVSEFPC